MIQVIIKQLNNSPLVQKVTGGNVVVSGNQVITQGQVVSTSANTQQVCKQCEYCCIFWMISEVL